MKRITLISIFSVALIGLILFFLNDLPMFVSQQEKSSKNNEVRSANRSAAHRGARLSDRGDRDEKLSKEKMNVEMLRILNEMDREKLGQLLNDASDFEIAARSLMQMYSPPEGLEDFVTLLGEMTPENAQGAADAYMETFGGFEKGVSADYILPRLLFNGWGLIDGEGALSFLKDHRFDFEKDPQIFAKNPMSAIIRLLFTASAIQGLAYSKPENSQKLLANEDYDNPFFLTPIASGMASRDIVAATEFVRKQSGGWNLKTSKNKRKDILRVIKMLAAHQIRESENAADAWILKLPEGEIRQLALKSMRKHYLEHDVKLATKWASTYKSQEFGDH